MDASELLLTTTPLDVEHPRYVKVVGMLPDSFATELLIDRQRISIVEPIKYRIRVDGVWIRLWNEKEKRCGAGHW